MKWTVKLVAEVASSNPFEHEIATIKRAEEIAPSSVYLRLRHASVEKPLACRYSSSSGYLRVAGVPVPPLYPPHGSQIRCQ